MPSGHLYTDDSAAPVGRRSARLAPEHGSESILWYESGEGPLSTLPGADPFVLGSILFWMTKGGQLHVHGSVSARLLSGLAEWQQAWIKWRPDRCSVVTITADEVRRDSAANPAAIAAFSGGVDSSYTVLRHALDDAGSRNADLRAVLLIHGFDIALDERDLFGSAQQRAKEMIAYLGLLMITIRTNLRDLDQEWNHLLGIGTASCLALVSDRYGVGLLGSCQQYDQIILPLGSNPITDPLTSTGELEIRHDGSNASRTEKIKYLATRTQGVGLLRVCWQKTSISGNCGTCEKCWRTRMNFRAAGLAASTCLPLTSESARPRTQLRSRAEIAEWISIRRHARTSGRGQVARHATMVIIQGWIFVVLCRSPALAPLLRRSKPMSVLRRKPRRPL